MRKMLPELTEIIRLEGIRRRMERFEYEDIVNLKYPLETSDRIKHPRMDLQDRAKIFAPFAALKGHDKELDDRKYDEYDEIERCIIEECMTEEF